MYRNEPCQQLHFNSMFHFERNAISLIWILLRILAHYGELFLYPESMTKGRQKLMIENDLLRKSKASYVKVLHKLHEITFFFKLSIIKTLNRTFTMFIVCLGFLMFRHYCKCHDLLKIPYRISCTNSNFSVDYTIAVINVLDWRT